MGRRRMSRGPVRSAPCSSVSRPDPRRPAAAQAHPVGLGTVHSVLMDRFVGRGRLEWWANQSTCLEMYDIAITVTVDAVGEWQATGRHASALDTTQREGWDGSVSVTFDLI